VGNSASALEKMGFESGGCRIVPLGLTHLGEVFEGIGHAHGFVHLGEITQQHADVTPI
jgi:hypothetical protein